MFFSARIKLTVWYSAIIMTISILFSFAIYLNINSEFRRFEKLREVIQAQEGRKFVILQPMKVSPHRLDLEMIHAARMRLITTLAIINAIILIGSGAAGYFLAGRTLRPIQNMVEEQNRFITDASHELRTPLTSLKAAIEVHLRDKNLTTQQAKTVLKSNLEDVNALQVLSDRLIQLTQYQHNGMHIQFETLSIKDVLSEAEKKVLPLLRNKNIDIEQEGKDYQLEGEKQLLLELFVILLDNAIKYSDEKTTITISVKSTDGKLSIFLKDQGIGIAKKDLPFIFDRFYRADTSRTKKSISGYGLGLSIAKHILDLHKGTIFVESELQKGTTFIVSLPKKQ